MPIDTEIKLESDLSLADRAYLAIENAILFGKIALGARLLEIDLAKNFSISRAPIREALHRLQFEGLAEALPRRGTYVIKPSRKDVIDVLEVREQLECCAVRLAATNISDETLNHLSDGLARIGGAIMKKRRAVYPANGLDFHKGIIQASNNEKLIQVALATNRSLRVVRLMSGASSNRARAALSEHLAVLSALKRRKPALAEKLMREHLRASASSILSTLKD